MKRQNLRSSFAMALLLALIVPILAACGGGTPAAQPTAAPAPAPEATAAPAAEPTAAPAETTAPAETAAPAAETAEPAAGGEGGTLRIQTGLFPDTLDPQDSSFSNEIALLSLNYEGLTAYDENLDTVPAAAESWEYNEDATEVTFTLRDGLTYSDGSPLTSQDFANAVRRALDPRGVVGDYQTIISMIQGADAIIGTEIPTDEASLDQKFQELGVATPDDKTISFTLTQPTPYFHTLAGLWVFYPAKQDLVEAGGETWYEDPANQIGNGPFQFTEIDRGGNLIAFEANENYWNGRPALDRVEFPVIEDLAVALEAYKNNEIDIFSPDPNDVPTIQADPVLGKEYIEFPGSCTLGLEFNLTKAPFDNLKVREAFAYGFDREGYVRDALQGTALPTLTWIPPGYPGYAEGETRFAFDPDAAKAALAEAGFPNGEGLPEIKISYSSSNPANQARYEYIAQMYQQSLGINITLDPVEATTLTNLRKSVDTHPHVIGGWCADYPDPQNWLSVYFQSEQNFAANIGYANEQFDQLVAEADVETDEARRAELYAQAQDLIVADVAHVFLYNNKNDFLVKPHVKGIVTTPQDTNYPGETVSLSGVSIEQ